MNVTAEVKKTIYESKYSKYKMWRMRTNYTNTKISKLIRVEASVLAKENYAGRLHAEIERGEVKPIPKTRSNVPAELKTEMNFYRKIWRTCFHELLAKYGESIMNWDEKDPLFIQMRHASDKLDAIDPMKGNAHGING